MYSRKEEPNPMAPMGVSPPIGITNHGGVEPLGLLCVKCYSFAMFKGTEVVLAVLHVLAAYD
jgi:hypothetical protein